MRKGEEGEGEGEEGRKEEGREGGIIAQDRQIYVFIYPGLLSFQIS